MEKHLLFNFLSLIFLVTSASAEPEAINKTAGEDCELRCPVPEGGQVRVLEWTKSDRHLLLYRNGKIMNSYQDESFTNRVQLQDPQLKKGTVILRNLTVKDTGTFKCEALVETAGQKRTICHSISLTVTEKSSEEKTGVWSAQKDTIKEENKKPDQNKESEATNNTGSGIILGVVLFFSVAGVVVIAAIAYWKRALIKQWLQKWKTPETVAHEPLNV